MSVNKVILLGNTGGAPGFKEFNNGGCVATFSLATTKRGFTTKDGQKIPERTEWHNIVLQNGLAKLLIRMLKRVTNCILKVNCVPEVMTMPTA